MLSNEQAVTVDEAMTTAALITHTAYANHAEMVHFAIDEEDMTLLITPGPRFNLEAVQNTHPSFAFFANNDAEASSNGTAKCVSATIPFDFNYTSTEAPGLEQTV